MITEFFLENLRKLIEVRSLSQSAFAKEVQMSQTTINSWYSRRALPNTETIEKLASHFNVEPYYFFMKPGTQGEVRSVERDDDFVAFMDKLAQEFLTEDDRAAFVRDGGARTFLRIMRNNYETYDLRSLDWYEKLIAQVAKYATLDIIEKIRNKRRAAESSAKKSESA